MVRVTDGLPAEALREVEYDGEEEWMQNLRSKATELRLREEYDDSMKTYSQIISFCEDSISQKNPDGEDIKKLRKALCLAYSNRAEAGAKMSRYFEALADCDEALRIDGSHVKTLVCKGKILLSLNRYKLALECFKSAQGSSESADEEVDQLLGKCKKLEFLSRTGGFDVSDWVLSGFNGKPPEFSEFIGAVEIRKSEISGRGLFATKNIECGTLVLVTKAVAVDRVIMPQDSDEKSQLVLWKNFVDRVEKSAEKCRKLKALISNLSTGENEQITEVPDIQTFKPETDVSGVDLEKQKLVNILDANAMVENGESAKVLGKNSDYRSVGLWILPSFINHSCTPNVRRVHIGDYVLVHASRDLKAGEELTFAYFDVLSLLGKRREMSKNWGFNCNCKRCEFEEKIWKNEELREIERLMTMEGKGFGDLGNLIYRFEEEMKKMMVRGKSKGFLRASVWGVYEDVLTSEKMIGKWGRKIPAAETVVESVAEVVGSDERILRVLTARLRTKNGIDEVEKAVKLGKGIYGKIMKKSALRNLIQLG